VRSYGSFHNDAILFLHSSGNRSMLRYIELLFHTGTYWYWKGCTSMEKKDQPREAFGLIRICQHLLKVL